MKVFKDLEKVTRLARFTAIAVGNFDGMHLGHQKILRQLTGLARRKKLASSVLTFDPHPELVLGKKKIKLINTLSQRLNHISEMDIDFAVVLPFNHYFANLSPRAFVEKILFDKLMARAIVVGENFRFGRNRQGNKENLCAFGKRLGIDVYTVPPAMVKRKVINSSFIRRLLGQGMVEKAALFLGRPYEISGKVVAGSARGKTLGFPTANLLTANEILPPGVFIAITKIENKTYPSLAVIGSSPTFGHNLINVETHLLDFATDIRGKKIAVSLIRKLRPILRFPNAEALVYQISKDVEKARRYFKRHTAQNWESSQGE